MWRVIDAETDTRALEVPGVGVLVANSCGMTTVYGARLRGNTITREDRTTPPLRAEGLTAAEIRAKQPLVADAGALNYLVFDPDAAEF